ncbi:hypothetical protein CAPTEDRAFT_176175 [Capitella teleta]|uniref:AB hydrolase-1 domain-containing protein n=1 Tax=Capitella teleta TaxID=283909 RepID=R7TRZ4_CAPTE|nr:hypothetical protein CAPTEDRAFT_176175 [Capitella teleta]|eukprot:ELT96409.1 hypothetical protein CAPTEDRAFT_176175 [Capitella teleta]
MPQLQPIGKLLVTFSLGLVFVIITCLSMLKSLIVKGPKKVFGVTKRLKRPDLLDDPSLGEHKFARMKHITLHYVEKGDQNKPLMLFIHGFPEFWYSWRHQLKEFSDTHRCVAVDMRGYNESDKPHGVENYSIDKLSADIKELVLYLGYEKCLLVAHDWGAVVAYAVVDVYPEILDSLIICNGPYGRAFAKVLQKSRAQFFKSWYTMMFQWPLIAEFYCRSGDLNFLNACFTGKKMGAKAGSFSDDDIEAYKYVFRNFEDLTPPINYYRAAGRYRPGYAAPKTVCVRSLIIWGTEDGALGKEIPEVTREYFDDLTIQYIEGGSHWIQNEEPDQVNQLIREFISGKKDD